MIATSAAAHMIHSGHAPTRVAIVVVAISGTDWTYVAATNLPDCATIVPSGRIMPLIPLVEADSTVRLCSTARIRLIANC